MAQKPLSLIACLLSIGKNFPEFEPYLALDDAKSVVDNTYAYILNCREDDTPFVEDVILGLKPAGLPLLRRSPVFAQTYLTPKDSAPFRRPELYH